MTTQVASLGLIEGRFEMPVSEYLLSADIADQVGFHSELYLTARQVARNWAVEHAKVKTVHFYGTGLTTAVLGAVDGLRQAGIKVVAMSYDRETSDYIPVELVSFDR